MTSIKPTNKDLLTPIQLENEFGINLQKQAKLRMRKSQGKSNSLPFIKLGKFIFYRRDSIEKWLDANTINLNSKD